MQNTIFRLGLLSSFLFSATFSSGQTWVNVGNPVSGSINALSSFGGTLYLGGNFQRLNGGESDFTALAAHRRFGKSTGRKQLPHATKKAHFFPFLPLQKAKPLKTPCFLWRM